MTKKTAISFATALLATSAMTMAGGSDAAAASDLFDEFADALTGGTPYVDARYRFEYVDQSGFSKNAKASNIRTRLGYRSGEFHGLSGVLEFEDVSPIGNESYNSTINGKTSYPVVADPDSTELNQAYLSLSAIPDTVVKYGRHNLKRNNVRFIGDVGWRQNNQVHDGVAITNKSLPDTEIFYGYSYNINRIFGDDHPTGDFNGNIHMVDVTYKGIPGAKLVAYGYFLDLDNGTTVSSRTYGVNFKGKTAVSDEVNFLYDLEYARQSDHGSNPTSYDANYYRIEPGISFGGFTVKAAYELLESDNGGTVAFTTPLATLHKWNGWADIFLATPAAGLEDIYGTIAYKVSGTGNEFIDGTKLAVIYHDFSADSGGADYGREWDVNISQTFKKHYSVGLKFADYNADTFSVDTQKVILSLGFKFN